EVVVTGRRLGSHDAAVLEAQPDILHDASLEDGGKRVANLALGFPLDRAREDLAVRHVEPAVGCEPTASVDAESEVRVGADDAELATGVKLASPRVQIRRDAPPVGDRILIAVDVTGAVDEVLVLGE